MNAAGALSDDIRVSILELLRDRQRSAGEIAAHFDISRPAVSRHLRVLREAGLVRDVAKGRSRVYSLETGPLRDLQRWLNGMLIAERWETALDALETEVRRTARSSRGRKGNGVTPQPNGTILRSADGLDLVITRRFNAPIEDVWASITDPERTARWFGAWRGTGGVGRVIELQMAFEEGQPWFEARIDACEPPRHLAITQLSGGQEWRLEASLTEGDGVTALRFAQHQLPADQAGAVGPGWEYYLDMLAASLNGTELPKFEDYYPAQQEYYERQLAGA